jgi:hypothetical protein
VGGEKACMKFLRNFFASLTPLGKIADAVERIVRMFEKWWDARQIAMHKAEGRADAIRDANESTYRQLDQARDVKQQLDKAEEAEIDEILIRGPKP